MLRKYRPKTLSLIGLMATVVALLASAYGAGSASAGLPELLWCMEGSPAQYETKAKCEEGNETGTTLTWTREGDVLSGETVEVMFSSAAGLMTTVPGGLHIECTSDTGSATVVLDANGNQLFEISMITFEGCKELIFGTECHSEGNPEGVILTSAIDAVFVYLKAAKSAPVGLLLEPIAQPFTTITCPNVLIKENVEGSIIGEITPLNSMVASGTVKFAENAAKEQQWTKVEETAAKFELKAFGEKAVLVSEETVTLLVGGAAAKFIVDA